LGTTVTAAGPDALATEEAEATGSVVTDDEGTGTRDSVVPPLLVGELPPPLDEPDVVV
jgi:hypothetical protein